MAAISTNIYSQNFFQSFHVSVSFRSIAFTALSNRNANVLIRKIHSSYKKIEKACNLLGEFKTILKYKKNYTVHHSLNSPVQEIKVLLKKAREQIKLQEI